MFDKMKQLMEVKKQAERIKKELDAEVVEINDAKGIKIAISGSQNFRSVQIDADLIRAENKDSLERDLLRSMNAAIKRSQEITAKKMSAVMPGLPGF